MLGVITALTHESQEKTGQKRQLSGAALVCKDLSLIQFYRESKYNLKDVLVGAWCYKLIIPATQEVKGRETVVSMKQELEVGNGEIITERETRR